MAFETAQQNAVLASASCGIALMEAGAMLENAIEETNLFIEEAQFKVTTEGGTDEDLRYFREEAKAGFIASAKDILLKIVDTIKTFFSELKEKVIKLFAAKDIDANLEKVEKKIKMNPILKNKKIKINDGEKKCDAIKEHKTNLSKLLAKCNSGEDVSVDDVEEEEEKFNKAWIAAAGATVVLTFGAVIAAVKKARDDLGKAIGDAEDDIMSRIKSAQKKVDKVADPEKAATLTKLCQSAAKAARKEGDTILSNMLDMWKAVKNAVSRSRDADDDVFDESVNPYEGLDLDEDLGDDIPEGDIDDFINALDELSDDDEYPVDDVPPDDADEQVPVYAGDVDLDETNESSDDAPVDDMKDIDEVDPQQKKEIEKEMKMDTAKESADSDETHSDSSSEDETLESVNAELDDLFSGLKEFYSEGAVAEQTCCECGEPIVEGTECHVTESGGIICEACWKKENS